MSISFTVENDIITSIEYSATYQCPSGSSSTWGHFRWANVEIRNASFTYLESIKNRHIIDGNTFPTIIRGNFQTLTTASGSIKAGCATFNGNGLSTQCCIFLDTWTAEKISEETPSRADDFKEYDKRLERVE